FLGSCLRTIRNQPHRCFQLRLLLSRLRPFRLPDGALPPLPPFAIFHELPLRGFFQPVVLPRQSSAPFRELRPRLAAWLRPPLSGVPTRAPVRLLTLFLQPVALLRLPLRV